MQKNYRMGFKIIVWGVPKIGVPLVIIHFRLGVSLVNLIQLLGYHHFRTPPDAWEAQRLQLQLAPHQGASLSEAEAILPHTRLPEQH